MLDFIPTDIPGLVLIEPRPMADERGEFARTFDAALFAAQGLCTTWAQGSRSFNRRAGTLRGLHFQKAPYEEDKLVRCTRGAIFDVVVDLRPGSPRRRAWYGVELTDSNGRALYIPKGLAHGFITLGDATEVEYLISEYYHPEAGAGVRWDDPAFGITWPRAPSMMNQRDREWPLLGGDT